MLGRLATSNEDMSRQTELVDWSNPSQTGSINTIAYSFIPGGTNLNAAGAYISSGDIGVSMSPFAWKKQNTRYQLKSGYGDQWIVNHIEMGFYGVQECSYGSYDGSKNYDTLDAAVKTVNDNSPLEMEDVVEQLFGKCLAHQLDA